MSISIGLTVLVGFICCVTFCIKICCFDGGSHLPSIAELTAAISPQSVVLEIELDASIIESYPKIVLALLGESRRLPKPDGNTCPIWLLENLEYLPKETLKIIPDCNLAFHADCIDEGLHMNMTCPVCRTSPNQQPSAQAS